ncbi:MAG TPA: Crp/Fnr family transcriptional regulator, partial [Marinilabiliaceae bacterium]|nr:Crp/Fnr family transcriptional regulator [Marinilabiliaceae bacterium]
MAANKKSSGPEPTIKDIPILYSVLNVEEKNYLEKNHTVTKYRKNQIIYQEGELPT